MKETLVKISRIGIKPNDDYNIVLIKQFLIYQGLAMSMGGLLWGTLLLVFNYPAPSIIPYGYTVITAVNFYFFDKTKNFVICRNIQTSISLLLPFVLQWFLGGFAVSGGVMLWAIIALTSSVSYQNIKSSLVWLSAFVVLTLFSLVFDGYFFEHYNMGAKPSVSLVFLVVNIIFVSGIVFALVLYFTTMNNTNMEKLKATYTKLMNTEKLAVLGQISAGVAHEVNTPLGAIKSSAEESSVAFHEALAKLPIVMADMQSKDKDLFIEFLTTIKYSDQPLSTKEEREKRKQLRAKLEMLNVENSRFIADRLVQVGIFDTTPQMVTLAKLQQFEGLMIIAYNLLNQQKNNDTIRLAVDKASRIVKALKTYLHTSGGEELEPTNIRDNIETVLTIYHNRLKQGVKVIKNYEDVPDINAYPDQLNQVWTNLVVNAVQAMDNTGTLTIGIKKEDEYVVVSIKDTGVGIPEDIQRKIFDPFFTTKVSGEGTGLGLDIIKRILDDHQAQISFKSTVGIGTTFYVKLPISSVQTLGKAAYDEPVLEANV